MSDPGCQYTPTFLSPFVFCIRVNFFSEPSLRMRISGRWALIRHADIMIFMDPPNLP